MDAYVLANCFARLSGTGVLLVNLRVYIYSIVVVVVVVVMPVVVACKCGIIDTIVVKAAAIILVPLF